MRKCDPLWFTCPNCGVTVPRTPEFCIPLRPGWCGNRCRKCTRKHNKTYKTKHRDRLNTRRREWGAEHADDQRQKAKIRYLAFSEYIKEMRMAKYYGRTRAYEIDYGNQRRLARRTN